MLAGKKIKIGEVLVESGEITREQLNAAIAKQHATGERLGEVLVDMRYVSMDRILELLSRQLNVPLVDVKNYAFDPEKVLMLPEIYARRWRAIVLDKNDKGYLVGMADPQDVLACDQIEKVLNAQISVALVNEVDLFSAIDMAYRHTAEISTLAKEVSEDIGGQDYDVTRLTEGISETDSPILKLLQSIFEDAVQVNASDIHIEPDESVLRIRQRIDGILHEQVLKEKRVSQALTLRLKLMAGLNITEKRLPQDGRFSIRIHGKSFDVRLSSMPVQYGESVVMRLLNQSASVASLEEMGMTAYIADRLRRLIELPNGIILVTGPTGSGKTTTLYSLLNVINKPELKIITVEDPVEYRMERINQIQVQHKIELSFARILRSVLRQDPDVIMVGELRDEETVSIALRAALTGHLVLSTLHTNDATSSVIRLLDMGAEGYITGSVLRAVLAQRLVRRICQNCITDRVLSQEEKVWLKSMFPDIKADSVQFKYGAGCVYCHNTGYKGQIGVYELLEINYLMADALRVNDVLGFEKAARECREFSPLTRSGMSLVQGGVTSLPELIRITGEGLPDQLPAGLQ